MRTSSFDSQPWAAQFGILSILAIQLGRGSVQAYRRVCPRADMEVWRRVGM
jgi:hypothetical protein